MADKKKDERELLTEEILIKLIEKKEKATDIVNKYRTSQSGLIKKIYALSFKDGKVYNVPELLGSENIKASSRGLYIPMNKLKETNEGDEYAVEFDENTIILKKVA